MYMELMASSEWQNSNSIVRLEYK